MIIYILHTCTLSKNLDIDLYDPFTYFRQWLKQSPSFRTPRAMPMVQHRQMKTENRQPSKPTAFRTSCYIVSKHILLDSYQLWFARIIWSYKLQGCAYKISHPNFINIKLNYLRLGLQFDLRLICDKRMNLFCTSSDKMSTTL